MHGVKDEGKISFFSKISKTMFLKQTKFYQNNLNDFQYF